MAVAERTQKLCASHFRLWPASPFRLIFWKKDMLAVRESERERKLGRRAHIYSLHEGSEGDNFGEKPLMSF